MSRPLAQRAFHMYVGYSELIVTAPKSIPANVKYYFSDFATLRISRPRVRRQKHHPQVYFPCHFRKE